MCQGESVTLFRTVISGSTNTYLVFKDFSLYIQEKLVLAASHEGACRVWTLADQRLRVSVRWRGGGGGEKSRGKKKTFPNSKLI